MHAFVPIGEQLSWFDRGYLLHIFHISYELHCLVTIVGFMS